jgi:hypothetical protein
VVSQPQIVLFSKVTVAGVGEGTNGLR